MINPLRLLRIFWALVAILFYAKAFSQSYDAYYVQINQAREAVIAESYILAINRYEKAFRDFEFAFARDWMHAAQVAAHEEDLRNVYTFLQGALERGVPILYIQEEQEFQPFFNTELGDKLKQKAPQFEATYLASINPKLRWEVNEMFAEDQAIRERYYKRRNFFWRPFIGRKWRRLNAKQVERLIEMSQKQGFPGEKLIGLDYAKYHPKVSSIGLSAGMPIVLLLHHYSHTNPSFDSLLFEQVQMGNLYLEHFATVCDFEARYGKGKYPGIGETAIRFRPENPAKAAILRKKLGLLSKSDYQKLEDTFLHPYWKALY